MSNRMKEYFESKFITSVDNERIHTAKAILDRIEDIAFKEYKIDLKSLSRKENLSETETKSKYKTLTKKYLYFLVSNGITPDENSLEVYTKPYNSLSEIKGEFCPRVMSNTIFDYYDSLIYRAIIDTNTATMYGYTDNIFKVSLLDAGYYNLFVQNPSQKDIKKIIELYKRGIDFTVGAYGSYDNFRVYERNLYLLLGAVKKEPNVGYITTYDDNTLLSCVHVRR